MFRKITKGWQIKSRDSRRLDRLSKNRVYWRKGKFYIKVQYIKLFRLIFNNGRYNTKYPFPHKNYGVWNSFERELHGVLSKRDIIYFNIMKINQRECNETSS